MDYGLYYANCRGSFVNKPGEGVGAILDRWIEFGRPRLERRGERVTGRRRKPARRRSITGDEKLPGALGLGP